LSARAERLDAALVRRGLAESRERAQRLIRAGQVRVNGHPVDKPAAPVLPDDRVEAATPDPYVSRGAYKLLAALDHWKLDVRGRVCLDVGASTGGFTDVLLQRGAVRVYAVDVGTHQLHWKLRSDPRVDSREQVNARYLQPGDFSPAPEFACLDVSFISIARLLPSLRAVLPVGAPLVTLIKPQFEAGPSDVGRGGVVRDEAVRQRVIEAVRGAGEALGFRWHGVIPSPLQGPAGNTEFLACWSAPGADGTRIPAGESAANGLESPQDPSP
jgi:23S rRNA (cytidine1920-2'-O)/16S rRNA (cytidine1409-2'-O)-methyltransferase